jgi:2-isopropylmalate synthase
MSLIYDWNQIGAPPRPTKILLADETLRDGLQSPSVRCPSVEEKVEILHVLDALRVDSADLGLPGAGPHVVADVERLAREIVSARLAIKPYCAARTVEADITPIVEIAQRTGLAIEVAAFIGSSRIRQLVEGWDVGFLERATERAVTHAVSEGLPVLYVTEDTTRAHPDALRRLYGAAIRAGAARVCAADTVGHATPEGARAVVRFVVGVAAECGEGVEVDWHGHRDRGFAVLNSLAALHAGATRLHATALGVGERAGNTPMDLLLINLVLLGYLERDLSRLRDYCELVSRAYHVPIPASYPAFGRDAFRTATGVHAAAVVKALHRNDRALADAVYCSIPASLVGREQQIDVGPMSGRSNVEYWLEKRDIPRDEPLVERIFAKAKDSATVLTEDEILTIVAETRARASVAHESG